MSTTDAGYVRSVASMGTMVTVRVIGHGTSQRARRERTQAVDRAIAWFARVEAVCSRFDAQSELRRLSARIGDAVPVSAMLFEAVQFALAVADVTQGAFDPTVGHRMEAHGFNRAYQTGEVAASGIEAADDVSYRDVTLDAEARSITLHRPLVLDLGAVAKGLAVDMASRELAPLADFLIDAGGEGFVGGHNADGAPWSVGIRHPRDATQLLETLRLSDAAMCTSGDYERPGHIVQVNAGETASAVASATVVAPSAMVADALATAAFVLGPIDGIAMLEDHDVQGMLVTTTLDRFTTRGWTHD